MSQTENEPGVAADEDAPKKVMRTYGKRVSALASTTALLAESAANRVDVVPETSSDTINAVFSPPARARQTTVPTSISSSPSPDEDDDGDAAGGNPLLDFFHGRDALQKQLDQIDQDPSPSVIRSILKPAAAAPSSPTRGAIGSQEQDGSDQGDDDEAPVARRKTQKRVVDSDHEAPQPSSSRAPNLFEDDEDLPAVRDLSKQERLKLLADKKAAERLAKETPKSPSPSRQPSEGTHSGQSDIEQSGSEQDDSDKKKKFGYLIKKGKKAKKQREKGPLSKKEMETMNRETASVRRDARLEIPKTIKKDMNVKSLLVGGSGLNFSHVRPTILEPTRAGSAVRLDTPISFGTFPGQDSSSSIHVESSQIMAPSSADDITVEQPAEVTRTVSAPAAIGRRVVPPPPGRPTRTLSFQKESDSEDELPSMSELQEREAKKAREKMEEQAKQDRRRLFEERKAAALAAAMAISSRPQKTSTSATRMSDDPIVDDDDVLIIEETMPDEGESQVESQPTISNMPPPTLTSQQRRLKQFQGGLQREESLSESQQESQFVRHGKTFGIGTSHAIDTRPSSTFDRETSAIVPSKYSASGAGRFDPAGAIRREQLRARKSKKPVDQRITKDGLDKGLQARMRQQAFEAKEKKALAHQSKMQLANEQAQAKKQTDGTGSAPVNIADLLQEKEKKKQAAIERGEDPDAEPEDEDDDDWNEDDEDEPLGSGSDNGIDDEAEEAASGSEAAEPAADDEDDDESQVQVKKRKAKTFRVAGSDDEEGPDEMATDVQESAPAPLPTFMNDLGGGDDDGFSQLFDETTQVDGVDEDGFKVPSKPRSPPAPTFMGPRLITEAEQLEDAMQIEAQAGMFREPSTPREAPAAPRYLNKEGLYTQTKPLHMLDLSPSDSPSTQRSFGASPTPVSTTQVSATQIEGESQQMQQAGQSPSVTRPRPSHGLRRANGLTLNGLDERSTAQRLPSWMTTQQEEESQNESIVPETLPQDDDEAEQEKGSEADDEDAEQDRDDSDAEAEEDEGGAQPVKPANAFDMMRQAAVAQHNAASEPAPVQTKARARNQFVEAEAGLSDEENMGLGAVSSDEDEAGHDAELESLVDNEEIDLDKQLEQDRLAAALHLEKEAQADEKVQARVQNVVDGKERKRRKNGFNELDDDDIDDDFEDFGRAKRQRKDKKAENTTIDGLRANPETMHFANAYNPAVELNEGDVDFLQSGFAAAGSGSEDEEDELEIVCETQFDDELSSHDVADLLESKRGRRAPVYDDSNMLFPAYEGLNEEEMMELESMIPAVGTSSPQAAIKVKNKMPTEVVRPRAADPEADVSRLYQQPWKRDASGKQSVWDRARPDESSSGGGSSLTAAGNRSSVTSFARVVPKTNGGRSGSGKASASGAMGGSSQKAASKQQATAKGRAMSFRKSQAGFS